MKGPSTGSFAAQSEVSLKQRETPILRSRMKERKTISGWLEGKEVLVTGATGFVGKVLVEKILRCFPKVGKLYLLIRPQKGKQGTERWAALLKNPLFERAWAEQPESFSKVVVVNGDIQERGMGLSQEDRTMLENNVSVIFHTAATVRFDDPLPYAVLMNTRGSYEITKLAENMKNLEVLQYVSTTYCNCNLDAPAYDERVYPAYQDWRTVIQVAENDPVQLAIIKDQVLGGHPNTYTFSKSLAEQIMEEKGRKIPIVILRPSVVIGCLEEPIPGWLDNFNGPVGVTCGVNKGVLRAFKANPDSYLDYVACDFVVNGMILAAWHTANNWRGEVKVYNCAYADMITCTFSEIVELGVHVQRGVPLDNSLWHPFLLITSNPYLYITLFYIYHIIPALVLDGILMLLRFKPMLMKLNIKIYNATQALASFTDKTFKFKNASFRSLWKEVPAEEKKLIYLEPPPGISAQATLDLFQSGMKKYLLHEKEEDLPVFIGKYKRRYYLHVVTKIAFWAFCLWYILSKVVACWNAVGGMSLSEGF